MLTYSEWSGLNLIGLILTVMVRGLNLFTERAGFLDKSNNLLDTFIVEM